MSTTEAEYKVVVEAYKEVIWMKDFIGDLGIYQEEYRLYNESQSAIHLVENVAYHSRMKHIQRIYHWLRERLEDEDFTLVKIPTEENRSDMLTKVLLVDKLTVCWRRIGLTKTPCQSEGGDYQTNEPDWRIRRRKPDRMDLI